jgi:hypothetical protein
MFPLKNREKYVIGFQFKKLYPNKEPFISQGLAGKPHLGLDILTPIGTPLYAPSNGSIAYVLGKHGGHQAYFKPDGKKELFRFLHLNVPPKAGRVNEGDQFGVTGNSGSATNTPHVHIDISKNGILDLGNINNFLDPLTYNYETNPPLMFPITFKIKLIANNSNWPTLQKQIDKAALWYKEASGNRINLQIDVEHTQFSSIPFTDYDLTEYFAWGVEKNWQMQNILPKATGYDMVMFQMRNSDWTAGTGHTQAVMLRDLADPIKLQFINSHSDELDNHGMLVFDDHFTYLICHEVSHAMLELTGQDTDSTGQNVTHKCFYSEMFKDVAKIFEVVNYQALTNVLAVRRKEIKMTKYFKVNDHGKLGIMILEGFSGTIIFEDNITQYNTLLQITGINDATPTINIP